MDKHFLMGNSDYLQRTRHGGKIETVITEGLRHRLLTAAIGHACSFYAEFFDKPAACDGFEEIAREYDTIYSEAVSLGLMQHGGIQAKDHLNLWCLSRVLSPQVYVESGVFIGSSLHAISSGSAIDRVIAIDPNLTRLKVPGESIPHGELIDDKDFSQIEFASPGNQSLAYFDDHINTADRIIQAASKGFRYVLFDDSAGFEGVCQRLYPATPTVPMIVHADLLSAGDELHWTYANDAGGGLVNIARRLLMKTTSARVSFVVTQECVNRCTEARALIRKWHTIPELGDFIPQMRPAKTADTSKFLIELSQE